MNTATNRFSAVFVSFLVVLLMALWSVPAAWANTASERDSAKAQCIASGDSWTEESDGSYSCESDTSTITCMGDELNLCIGCLSASDYCTVFAQKTMESGMRAIPLNKLTPAQQQQVRKLKAKHQARLAQGTTKPAQKTYDLRPLLNRGALREGDNTVYTTPEGIGIVARQQGGKLIGWSARDRQGQPMTMRLSPFGTDCWGCPTREGGFVPGGPGDCPIKIVMPGTCPTFPIPPKDPFPASSQPTPKAGMTQPMTKPAITPPQQPGEPMPEGPGRPGEPMKTLPNMNTAPVKK